MFQVEDTVIHLIYPNQLRGGVVTSITAKGSGHTVVVTWDRDSISYYRQDGTQKSGIQMIRPLTKLEKALK